MNVKDKDRFAIVWAKYMEAINARQSEIQQLKRKIKLLDEIEAETLDCISSQSLSLQRDVSQLVE